MTDTLAVICAQHLERTIRETPKRQVHNTLCEQTGRALWYLLARFDDLYQVEGVDDIAYMLARTVALELGVKLPPDHPEYQVIYDGDDDQLRELVAGTELEMELLRDTARASEPMRDPEAGA